ncbi:MAG: FtsX-like permease family protein, partial [Lachnospiraceae bacterium]|nr:FtsX-like permease family protein [Lachnospiraceae bacterium]
NALIMGSYIPTWFYNPNSRYYQDTTIDTQKTTIVCSINDWNYEMDYTKKLPEFKASSVAVLSQTNDYNGTDYAVYMNLRDYDKQYNEFMKILKPTDRKKAMKKFNNYETIYVYVDNVKNVEAVQDAIKELGFQTSSLNSMYAPMEKMSQTLQLVLGAIGAVAMLVSAISIANTMVMSIYERTKEIGVMKVLGCLVKDIKKLFLFEAGMIGLIGGIIGIVLSYIASFLINKFGAPIFEQFMGMGMVDTGVATKYSIIPLWLPLAVAAFAMAVGLLSGYYPARRATKISAIEAMKTGE